MEDEATARYRAELRAHRTGSSNKARKKAKNAEIDAVLAREAATAAANLVGAASTPTEPPPRPRLQPELPTHAGFGQQPPEPYARHLQEPVAALAAPHPRTTGMPRAEQHAGMATYQSPPHGNVGKEEPRQQPAASAEQRGVSTQPRQPASAPPTRRIMWADWAKSTPPSNFVNGVSKLMRGCRLRFEVFCSSRHFRFPPNKSAWQTWAVQKVAECRGSLVKGPITYSRLARKFFTAMTALDQAWMAIINSARARQLPPEEHKFMIPTLTVELMWLDGFEVLLDVSTWVCWAQESTPALREWAMHAGATVYAERQRMERLMRGQLSISDEDFSTTIHQLAQSVQQSAYALGCDVNLPTTVPQRSYGACTTARLVGEPRVPWTSRKSNREIRLIADEVYQQLYPAASSAPAATSSQATNTAPPLPSRHPERDIRGRGAAPPVLTVADEAAAAEQLATSTTTSAQGEDRGGDMNVGTTGREVRPEHAAPAREDGAATSAGMPYAADFEDGCATVSAGGEAGNVAAAESATVPTSPQRTAPPIATRPVTPEQMVARHAGEYVVVSPEPAAGQDAAVPPQPTTDATTSAEVDDGGVAEMDVDGEQGATGLDEDNNTTEAAVEVHVAPMETAADAPGLPVPNPTSLSLNNPTSAPDMSDIAQVTATLHDALRELAALKASLAMVELQQASGTQDPPPPMQDVTHDATPTRNATPTPDATPTRDAATGQPVGAVDSVSAVTLALPDATVDELELPKGMLVGHAWVLYCCGSPADNVAPLRFMVAQRTTKLLPLKLGSEFKAVMRMLEDAATEANLMAPSFTPSAALEVLQDPRVVQAVSFGVQLRFQLAQTTLSTLRNHFARRPDRRQRGSTMPDAEEPSPLPQADAQLNTSRDGAAPRRKRRTPAAATPRDAKQRRRAKSGDATSGPDASTEAAASAPSAEAVPATRPDFSMPDGPASGVAATVEPMSTSVGPLTAVVVGEQPSDEGFGVAVSPPVSLTPARTPPPVMSQLELEAPGAAAPQSSDLPRYTLLGRNHCAWPQLPPPVLYLPRLEAQIDAKLLELGRKLHGVNPDGDCMFHTVSFFSGIDTDVLRWACAGTIAASACDKDQDPRARTMLEAVAARHCKPGHTVSPDVAYARLMLQKGRFEEAPAFTAICAALRMPLALLTCQNAPGQPVAFPFVADINSRGLDGATYQWAAGELNPGIPLAVSYAQHFAPAYLTDPVETQPRLHCRTLLGMCVEMADKVKQQGLCGEAVQEAPSGVSVRCCEQLVSLCCLCVCVCVCKCVCKCVCVCVCVCVFACVSV